MGGIVGDVLYGVGFLWGFGAGGAGAAGVGGGLFGVFGEGGVGDLQAVEEQAGAAGIDVVGGDALEDFADGLEDGGAVFG